MVIYYTARAAIGVQARLDKEVTAEPYNVRDAMAKTGIVTQEKATEIAVKYEEGVLDGYYAALAKHRYSPFKTFAAPRDRVQAEGWKNVNEHLAQDRYYLAIRRACKFGIEHVANAASGATIHFLLNRFDLGTGWQDVLDKKKVNARGREALIITYSELRFVYKNWNTFKNRVLFYRYEGDQGKPTACPQCEAPWEDGSRMITASVYGKDGKSEIKSLSLAHFWKENFDPAKARWYQKLIAELKALPEVRG